MIPTQTGPPWLGSPSASKGGGWPVANADHIYITFYNFDIRYELKFYIFLCVYLDTIFNISLKSSNQRNLNATTTSINYFINVIKSIF